MPGGAHRPARHELTPAHSKGQKIPVIVNAFAIRQPPKFTAYQYDVRVPVLCPPPR